MTKPVDRYKGLSEEEIIKLEVERLLRAEKVKLAWTPDHMESRPSKAQLDPVLHLASQFKYIFVLGGNQCLAKGTLVATPKGPIPIENIRIGDTVYSEFGKEIKVLNVFDNGIKPCHSMLCRNKSYGKATADHVWLVEDGHGRVHERKLKDFRRDDKIARVRVASPLGTVAVADAYALGAFLGDGCSRDHGLAISSADDRIPLKISKMLEGFTHFKTHPKNYTWKFVGAKAPRYYDAWCNGRYAHEKIVDLEVVKTWDRVTCLNFVAGLIDTDGSVYASNDMVNLSYCSQSESIIKAVHYLFMALWQVDLSISIDARSKYKNGAVFEVYTRNTNEIEFILNELDAYLAIDRKRWSEFWRGIGGRRSHLDKLGITVSETITLEPTYDLEVDSDTHLYLLANGLVTHNSGKSNSQVRALVWMAEESSPYWRRPTDRFCNNKLCGAEGTLRSTEPVVLDYECPNCGNIWRVWGKDEPINILLVGEQLKNLQENLYYPRIKRLFQFPDEWHEDKLGSPFVQKVTNTRTGNSILFFPHGQGEEKARKAVQGYTIHAVFTDEQMPASVIEECQRRVDAKMGTFMMAFTMKTLDANVMRMMEAQTASGAAKMFKLSKLDNPVYAGSKELILKQLAGLSEEKKNTVLYGEVSYGEDYIYGTVETTKIAKEIPASYSTTWRHVDLIDPAIKTKAGRLVVAQDPHTKIWHVIKAQKISGMLHDKHLYEYHLKLRHEEGYKPTLSVSDDDAGFIGMARHHDNPTHFIYPPSKRSKSRGKLFLIKQSVGCLMSEILHIDPKFTLLWDEIREYRWQDGSRMNIVNSHKYHLVDLIQYFFDTLPDEEKMPERAKTWHEEILEANQPWSPPIPTRRSNQLKKKPKQYIMARSWRDLVK